MHKNLQDIQTEPVNCAAAQLLFTVFVLHSLVLLFLNFECNRVPLGLFYYCISMSTMCISIVKSCQFEVSRLESRTHG